MLEPFATFLGAVENGDRLTVKMRTSPVLARYHLAGFSTAKISGIEVVPHVSSHQGSAALDAGIRPVVPPLTLGGTERV